MAVPERAETNLAVYEGEMKMRQEPETIREILLRLSDRELIEILPYIRDENGEKISLIELKHILREKPE